MLLPSDSKPVSYPAVLILEMQRQKGTYGSSAPTKQALWGIELPTSCCSYAVLNSLPESLQSMASLQGFRRGLKEELFQQAFGH